MKIRNNKKVKELYKIEINKIINIIFMSIITGTLIIIAISVKYQQKDIQDIVIFAKHVYSNLIIIVFGLENV